MPNKHGKLKPDDELRLRKNYAYLADELDANHFLPDLFSRAVFTADDKEEIRSLPNRRMRTEKMLDKLFASGPGDAYNIFFEILEENYPHAAKQLKETTFDTVEDRRLKPDYSWFDSIPDTVKNRIITDADASRISRSLDVNWRHVVALLGVPDTVIEQERQNYIHGSITNTITSLLIKWRQRFYKEATIQKLVSVLIEVDEDGTCTIDWKYVKNALNRSQP